MANMARRLGHGDYQIGIYSVVQVSGKWVATTDRFGFHAKYATLGDAHLALTGETMRDTYVPKGWTMIDAD